MGVRYCSRSRGCQSPVDPEHSRFGRRKQPTSRCVRHGVGCCPVAPHHPTQCLRQAASQLGTSRLAPARRLGDRERWLNPSGGLFNKTAGSMKRPWCICSVSLPNWLAIQGQDDLLAKWYGEQPGSARLERPAPAYATHSSAIEPPIGSRKFPGCLNSQPGSSQIDTGTGPVLCWA